MVRIRTFAGLLALLLLMSCDQQQTEKPLQYSSAPIGDQVPEYRLTPHPLYNPQKLGETFKPLVDYLNREVPGARIKLEASRDYHAYEQKFRAREAEILMPNPWQTIEAMKVGYHVIAMWGDAEDFKGLIIVRKDGGIKTPDDLKGKVVSYPAPTALAAAVMPQYFLHTKGININKDIKNAYVGSQESSIMNVYMGHVCGWSHLAATVANVPEAAPRGSRPTQGHVGNPIAAEQFSHGARRCSRQHSPGYPAGAARSPEKTRRPEGSRHTGDGQIPCG